MAGPPPSPRWRWLTWAGAGLGLVVVLLGLIGSAWITAASPTLRRMHQDCTSEAGTWSADVEVGDLSPSGTLVSMVGPRGDEPWRLVQADDARLDEETTIDPDDLPLAVDWADRPRLMTPDGGCTIYLLPPIDGALRPVLVVGDSLAYGLVAGPEREAATVDQAAARGLSFTVDGYSGTTWGQAGDPGRRADERLRGAAATDPSVPIVVVLGANDAGQAVLAERLPTGGGLGPDTASSRQTTGRAIRAWVPRLVAGGRCVVLVTAPDQPITSYSLGLSYAFEADLVNTELEQTAAAADALVAPFADLSRDHHGPEGDPGSWFHDDQLHPDGVGTAAMADAVLDALGRCPAP